MMKFKDLEAFLSAWERLHPIANDAERQSARDKAYLTALHGQVPL